MSKSFVTLEQNICAVCGIAFDTGALLLDKRMRDKFEKHTITGNGMCGEHQKMKDDGFIALIGVDESKSEVRADDTLKQETAHRTGNLCHLKREAWENIMNVPVPEEMICFCDDDVIDLLKGMMP